MTKEELMKQFKEKFSKPIPIIANVGGDSDEVDLREDILSFILLAYNSGLDRALEVIPKEIKPQGYVGHFALRRGGNKCSSEDECIHEELSHEFNSALSQCREAITKEKHE